MLEKDMIQSHGFRNVVAGGEVTGFQLRIRIPYYRGIWASLLEGADVTVDGEEFSRDGILWTIGDRTLTLAELEAVDRPALAVRRAGRLHRPQAGRAGRGHARSRRASWPGGPPTCRPTWDRGSHVPSESSR